MTVTEGVLVSLEYTLKNDAGVQLESNIDGEPLQYTHGKGQLIPGLENALAGLAVGDTKSVKVAPEEGYGVPDERAVIEAPKEKIPPEALEVGALLQTLGQDGEPLNARVVEVKDAVVILDFNHPLAGEVLHFDVKILGVEPVTA